MRDFHARPWHAAWPWHAWSWHAWRCRPRPCTAHGRAENEKQLISPCTRNQCSYWKNSRRRVVFSVKNRLGRAGALSHPKNVHFWPFFLVIFWSFFGHFLGDFQDPFPDYSPFFDTQIAILISFSGSHLWMDFWANFGPFSDAKSPLKTGFYGYRKWAPKNGWNWTEKTTQNAS